MNTISDSIKQDIKEALDPLKANKTKAVVCDFTPLDIKNVRAKYGMSQDKFASAFGFNVGSLRHWERGARKPNVSALVLLNVVKNEPLAVIKALRRLV
ncbi:MAG: helix-turn-helix domain-containing protein [gamma proteobacterium symbiont of Bathyaustriella thionipta]|nr:helix-turn-helix domain-containing protein [gamma proteobacterium symbiont of Bathyaustriella thionipta]MCU7949009.1 helix-turn-helix domain-containing protein [gamma proteobacterium symbiont of Bathyaustriella thionipta]MCU7952209.1 helix-turn-helix domain-containing protein [gamma proteobacterium symbiont of Bathyaustriella thionipta]MCU7955593.1 helix-turn-helix domain-containing protein [gamma proteobacterium symbiont of Bathyaustriella thionipta]MCU7968943.1 helix-turn-helix domain-cont